MNALLVLIAVALVGLVFEVFLRMLEPVSNVRVLREVTTPQGSYLALRPGVHGLVLGREVTVNSEGYRGALRARHKLEGVTRVLIFGDSHTFSMGADDEHTYPAVVDRGLNARGLHCEVLNFGVPGQDLRQILLLMHARAFQYDPDVVVITFHNGDILESPDDMIPEDRAKGAGGASATYRLKVALLKHSYLARLVIPYGAALSRRVFGWTGGVTHDEQREVERNGKSWRALQEKVLGLKRELDRRGIALAFVLFPSMLPFDDHPARREFEALAAWLEGHGIPTLDLLPDYAGHNATQLTASLLDKHPNERGYAIAGNAVAKFLWDVVKNRASGISKTGAMRSRIHLTSSAPLSPAPGASGGG